MGKKKKSSTNSLALGVFVTQRAVRAVLLRGLGERFEVVRHFTRQRTPGGNAFEEASGDLGLGIADFEETAATATTSSDDFTIEFGGNAGGGSDLFMASEFGALGSGSDAGADDFAFDGNAIQAPEKPGSSILLEIRDILDECTELGYDRPAIAFCVGSPEVEYVELIIEKKEKKKKKNANQPARISEEEEEAAQEEQKYFEHQKLVERLAEVYEGTVDPERVAFVAMTPKEQQQRYLALVPEASEPVTGTVEVLRDQLKSQMPPVPLMDAEVSLYAGLARTAFPTDEGEHTAIVRVGQEDTLVLLMQGERIHHEEHLRSVTTFDPPETVCSRVLLQQDVQGIGTIHNVLIISEERQEDLVRDFSMFYPDARVAGFVSGLLPFGVDPADDAEAEQLTAMLPALGAAMRALGVVENDRFDDVNLLPKRLRRKKKVNVQIAWHTMLMAVLLFATVLFCVWGFFGNVRQMSEYRRQLRDMEDTSELSVNELQARIDSLQQVHTRYSRAINVLDSLMIGSDRWSRMLEKTSRITNDLPGVWIEQWSPQAETMLDLDGMSTRVGQMDAFAQRMQGVYHGASQEEIRDVPVRSFQMSVPVAKRLPEVASYLRNRVLMEDYAQGNLTEKELADAQNPDA